MKTIFQNVKSSMTLQESGIIDKRIKELEELSNEFISKAYNVDQEKTIEFLKEARFGGYSIIGEFWNGATRWTSNDPILRFCQKTWTQRHIIQQGYRKSCRVDMD